MTAKEGSNSASTSANLERTLFFDTIAQEILDNVLRFISLLPHAVKWSNHIPLRVIARLCRVNGGLGAYVNSRFRALCIARTRDCVDERRRYNWKIPTESVLWTDSIKVAHDFVLGGGGQSLPALIIGEMYDEQKHGRDMVGNFLDACPSVRSLSVVDKFGVWTSAFAAQLEKLEVVSNTRPAANPKCCSALRELHFNYKRNDANGLSWLGISGFDWYNIGKKLEKLTLSGFAFSADGLKRIRKHCNNLKHIDLDSLAWENKDIVDFISSYGDQLDSVHVYNMTVRQLKLVVETCQNARFQADVSTDYRLLPTLRILGPQLQKIKCFQYGDEFDRGEWEAAWNLCSNLEVLEANGLTVEGIRAIMRSRKERLREIRISFPSYEEVNSSNAKEGMKIIAKGTSNVELLQLRCKENTSLSRAFDQFIFENKSTLRFFSIYNNLGLNTTEMTRIITKLRQCSALEEVCFPEEPPKTVLKTMQRIGVHFRCCI